MTRSPARVRPVLVALSRAKCPRCGHVVVAASPRFRDYLTAAHDREVHDEGRASSPARFAPAAAMATIRKKYYIIT